MLNLYFCESPLYNCPEKTKIQKNISKLMGETGKKEGGHKRRAHCKTAKFCSAPKRGRNLLVAGGAGVEFRVKGVEVFAVQVILDNAQRLAGSSKEEWKRRQIFQVI